MATVVQQIDAALRTLSPAGGVFNAINTRESGVFPYIIFLRIVSTVNNSLGGPSGLQNTRVQIDVFDRSYNSAASLAEQVATTMTTTFPSCVQVSSFDVYEDAIKAYRVSADFSLWSTDP